MSKINVNSWKLWDDDIEAFEHEIELYRKMGEEIKVSYTDIETLPEDADINWGRRLRLALVVCSNETYKRLSYVMNKWILKES